VLAPESKFHPAMAKLGFQVGFIFAILVLMGLAVEGIPNVVSVGNFMSPLVVTVHCIRDSEDMGTVAMKPTESIRLTVPMNFHGTYICEFSATGKRNTSFDVVSPKCKCDGYWGCQWVVRSDGFYCNYALLYVWAQ
jgi:hypothetical protein